MSTPRDFHRSAMDFAGRGFMAQMSPDPDAAIPLFEQALELELAAIAALPEPIEPTYSVLHRSAGWMAIHCRQFRQAERLACKALAGDPPADIADELRDLLEQSNFRRHLDRNEVSISQREIKMNLVGRTVSNGVVLASSLLARVDNIQKLIYRIVQRNLDHPYRSRVPDPIRRRYPVFTAAPRAGSFTVSLLLGQPVTSLPGIFGPSEILHEFIDLIEIVNDDNIKEIEERIPDQAYRHNFLGLAKSIAPDGRDIRQIGFSANTNGNNRNVAFVRPASAISPVVRATPKTGTEFVEVSGILRYADASSSSSHNRIKLIEDNGLSHSVRVPAGLMNDIVRPMWNSTVTVVGARSGKQQTIMLNDIWLADQAANHVSPRTAGNIGMLL